MKRFIYILLIVTILSVSAFGTMSLTAYADVSESECDRVFIETLSELMPSDSDLSIVAEKELIYDISLQPLGYLYLFDAAQDGYAIVINAFGYYECTEIYFDAVSPYMDCLGSKVYVKTFTYLIYENDKYLYANTGLTVEDVVIETLMKKAYFASSAFTYSEETFLFTSRTDNKYELALRVPQYVSSATAIGCGAVTGTNIVIYYDRYLPNLIPNFEPGSAMGSNYLYKISATEINQTGLTLRSDMGTGADNGTTIPQFKTGMTKFCNNRGYSITFTSCMSGNNFNYMAAKQKLESGQPLVVFTDPFTVSKISTLGSQEILDVLYDSTAHAMASFGYREISYVLTNGQTRNDTYIQVSSGLDTRTTGYCKLDNFTTFDDVYSINIY